MLSLPFLFFKARAWLKQLLGEPSTYPFLHFINSLSRSYVPVLFFMLDSY